MRKDFDIEEILRPRDTELTRMAEEFMDRYDELDDSDQLFASDEEDIAEEYLDSLDSYLGERIPVLVEQGRADDAWNTVMQAYSEADEGCFEEYDGNEIHDRALAQFSRAAEAVKGREEREELLSLLMWIEGTVEMPSWVRSACSVLAHDAFDEPELLTVIAEWYREKYDADPVMTGAFWKGRLRDIAERMGNDEKWLGVVESMDQADPVFADMVYAENLARRGDERCTAVWDAVEKELDPESEEDQSIYYSLLWARYEWASTHGTDEEAEKAEDALNDFLETHGDDCSCGDEEEDEDECGCGCGHHHHHHDEEEHECCCGGHHHDEDHECGCGHHHHHDEEHECSCGHHHHER